MNLSTEELVSTIKLLEETASMDLSLVPGNTRNGFQMAIVDAKTQLAPLKQEYRNRMFSNSVGFVVTGPKADEYAEVAKKTAPSLFKLEADQLYASMAKQIEPTIGQSREFTAQQMAGLISLLRETALEAGASPHMQVPLFNESVTVNDTTELEAHVSGLVRDIAGPTLSALFLGKQLVDQAIASSFAGSVLGAVVVNRSQDDQEQELSQIFATRIDVPTDEDTEITEEFVIKTFESAKKTKTKKSK